MEYNKQEIEEAKEKLRKQLKDAQYNVYVFNSYKGLNWDNAQSKGFILAVPVKDVFGNLDIIQLNPRYLFNLGWDTHYKKSFAEASLFYDGVLGMSRAFNIVYNLSSWLFADLTKEEIKQICGKEDAGYILHNR